jgi:CO/xanthine dehydrogenase Mo-binding subunit
MRDFYEELEESFRAGFEPPPAPAEDKIEPWGETRIVGKPLSRVDAYERVSGAAEYTADILLPGMLYCATLRCPHSHAMVKNIDTSAAEKMPGVAAIITGKSPGADIPWYGGRTPQSRVFDMHCRYEGDEVAAVAAQNPYQAWDAVKAIKVEYEKLPFVIDTLAAAKPEAVKIHEGGNLMAEPRVIKRGDVTKGFSEADIVVEENFFTSVQVHVPMEVHGSVVRWDGDKLTIWDSTQGIYDAVLFSIARSLNLPLNKVRVICKYFGGGFGSKLELGKYSVIAALLARKTGRPVKCMLTREETLLCVGNRPEARMTLKAGVKKDGTLTALQLTNVSTPGAYMGSTTVGFQIGELYKCPNVQITESGYYTNAGKARAFRAPGFPSGSWCLEQMMDILAEKTGIDPIDLRLKNFTDFSQTRNMPYTSTGLRECLTEGARKFGWKEARAAAKRQGHIKRGVGVAAGMWQGGNGQPPYTAEVRMFVDGGVTLKVGAMDIGTGTKTAACMVAAEELGLPMESIRIENADSAVTPYAQSSGGSMTLPGLMPAVRKGAWLVKKQVMGWAEEALGVAAGDVEFKGNSVVSRSSPDKKKTVEEIFRAHGVMDVIGIGNRDPNPPNKATMPFAAHFAEVEVNTKTGETKVLRLLGANESGRVINLRTFNNQVFGGMTQGLGFGLTEKRVMDRQTGKMCNVNFHDYKVPTALDVPVDHEVLPIDPHDRDCNIVGCKGSGEPAHVPTAAAIANAVYNAIGVRALNSPIDPRMVLELLSKKKRG